MPIRAYYRGERRVCRSEAMYFDHLPTGQGVDKPGDQLNRTRGRVSHCTGSPLMKGVGEARSVGGPY